MLPDAGRRVLVARCQHWERVGRADLSVAGFRDEYDGFEDLFRADGEYNGELGNLSVRNR